MRLVNPSVEIKEQELGLNGVYKQIEWAGRHCYKSLDKTTDNSYKQFYNRKKDWNLCKKHKVLLQL